MRYRPRTPVLEHLEDRRLMATLTVNTASDLAPSTVFSLRDAINVVDGITPLSSLSPQQMAQVTGSLSDPDTIAFDIPGTGVQTITPVQALPTITAPVTIDGYTQPGSSRNTLAVGEDATILIELDGAMAGPTADGLVFTGGHSAVVGLAINRFGTGGPPVGQAGGVGVIFDNNAGGNVVWGCFIGTDPTGTIGEPSARFGVVISRDTGIDSVGGTQADGRNVIQVGDVGTLQQYGVEIDHEDGPYVLNNYLGTNAAGTGTPAGQTLANATALSLINVDSAHVGGIAPGSSNIIEGLYIGSDPGLTTNGYDRIYGNLIGTDVTGTHAIGGGVFGGVSIHNSISNVVGGSAPGMGNVIAAQGQTAVYSGADNPATVLGTVVEGNHIGTDLTGALSFGDAQGVVISSSGNAVGDVVPGSGNVIAYSLGDGVQIQNASSTGNKVFANSIYLNAGAGIAPATSSGVVAPAIASAYPVNTGLLIQGGTFINGAANAPYTVEFFANPFGTAQAGPFSAGSP